MTTYAEAKLAKVNIEAAVFTASERLSSFQRGPNGLTPDEVKFSPAYRGAKAEFDFAFAKLQAFNSYFVKTFAKEYRAERKLKYSKIAC